MLSQLHIRNFAVVRQLDIDFTQGMTAITGETGAGKSIALDALGLCLGNRADTEWVRAGSDKAEVVAAFTLTTDSPASKWLAQHELEADGDDCVVRRVVTVEGRSKAWINGYPATVGQLRELAPLLVNIHGQHEHQLLTRADHQLAIVDGYAQHAALLDTVRTSYQRWYQLRKQQKTLAQQSSDVQSRHELLAYQVQELDEFALAEGEYEIIDQQFKRAANSAALVEDSSFALNALFDGEHNNAHGLIQTALSRLEAQLDVDAGLAPAVQLLREAGVQIEEAARELRHYHEQIEIDDEQLHQLEQRVTTAVKLARKHQVEPHQLAQHHAALNAELKTLEDQQVDTEQLDADVKAAASHYRQAAAKLSTSRQQAAKRLSKEIVQSMQQLNMPHAQFQIAVDADEQSPATPIGTDTVRFLVSTNPGQPIQAMAKVASGGELSRISLAIQVITASHLSTPTLMFDEVDVGVSGPTAAVVGKLLRQLGTTNQVICVTHLPQVAAKAHQQFQVEKSSDGHSTETFITALSNEQRVIELARLLGGDTITSATKANAAELLAS
ncbi:DNA repair protein RecN [Pseudidiomarina aestuarii]|uniref:DNA repair protein RecN n=1 Tax=Pseudidiomarina aestuarii TaxID=624146 RepID=UPI003A979E1E